MQVDTNPDSLIPQAQCAEGGAIANPDRLRKQSEVAERLGGVSPVTMWRWIQAGVIPKPIKIRNRNYWPESTVQRIEREGSQ